MKIVNINSMTLLLNLLGAEANYYLNKVLLYTLGLEESFFITYLLDQFKLFKNEGKLRKDLSFYMSNSKISVYTTISEFRITELKKSATNKGIIKISQEGIPTKSYYYIDFDKLLEIISTNKSLTELAYEYAKIKNGIDERIESIEDIIDLRKHSVKSLRFLCKENKISYTGNDNKETLINKLIEKKNPELLENINSSSNFSTVDDISSTSGQSIHPLRENEDYEIHSGQFFRPLVDSKTVTKQVLIKTNTNTCHVHENVTKCNENVTKNSLKNIDNKEINDVTENFRKNSIEQDIDIEQEIYTCHERDIEIENIFKNLDINYTDTNLESTNIILGKLKGDKELLKEYLLAFHDQLVKNAFNIQNKSAFFSSKLKTPDEILIKKILSKKNLKLEEENKKIEKLKEIELLEEKSKKEEEHRLEMDLILKKFNELSIEKQEKVLHIAEEKRLKKIPDLATSLYLFKENSKITYYRMLSSDIKEVLSEENLL